jgi:hypothetical protein
MAHPRSCRDGNFGLASADSHDNTLGPVCFVASSIVGSLFVDGATRVKE